MYYLVLSNRIITNYIRIQFDSIFCQWFLAHSVFNFAHLSFCPCFSSSRMFFDSCSSTKRMMRSDWSARCSFFPLLYGYVLPYETARCSSRDSCQIFAGFLSLLSGYVFDSVYCMHVCSYACRHVSTNACHHSIYKQDRFEWTVIKLFGCL